jgi:hypothetical protein
LRHNKPSPYEEIRRTEVKALLKLEVEQQTQNLLLFSDPRNAQPFYIEVFNDAPKKATLDVLRAAERGGAGRFLRRVRWIMSEGQLPDVQLLEKGMDSVTAARWSRFQTELTTRLMEEIPNEPSNTYIPEGVMITLEDGAEVMVDQDMVPQVEAHRWRAVNPESDSTKVIHACKASGIDCPVFASSLHRFVSAAASDEVVWHRNGQYNNCRSHLIRYCDNPANERQKRVMQALNAMIEERSHRRGRPKKRYYDIGSY